MPLNNSPAAAAGLANARFTSSDISALEDRRCQAMVNADVVTLSALLDDALMWTHASAHMDNKTQLLDRIGGGGTRYLAIERSDESIKIHGAVAIASGLATMHASIDGTDYHLRNRYTDVWVRRDDGWRMIGWQSTKMAVGK